VLELGERPNLGEALERLDVAARCLVDDAAATDAQRSAAAQALTLNTAEPERLLDLGGLKARGERAATYVEAINAVEQAARLIDRLSDLTTQLRAREHPLLGHPTLTVCGIAGGFNDYTVPDVCSLTLNRRVLPLETDRDVLAEVEAVLAERARIDPTFAASVQLCSFVPPMETDVQSPVVRALRSATHDVVGSDPGVVGWSATCDASILTHGAGVPTVVFGPGSIARDAHRPNESVAVAELTQCARIFASTIVQLLGRS